MSARRGENMTSHFSKIGGSLLRLLVLIALVFTSLIPVRSLALAQGASAPIRLIRSLRTREYGVSAPNGLAFSSSANTFFILDNSAIMTLLTTGEDNAGTQVLSDVHDDALNVAFDKK